MTRLRRIAFLSEHASPVALLGGEDAGGQNVYVDEVSRNLGRLGFAVDVFTRRDSAEAPEVLDWAPGVRIVNLAAGPSSFLAKDDLWPLMPDFRNAFLDFRQRSGGDYALLHGNFWMSGWVASDLRRRLRVPAVQTFHAMGKTKQRHQAEADTSPPERVAVELAVVRGVDRLIAQCPSERDELVDDYQAPEDKVAVIPSAVNVERFRPVPMAEARARLGLRQDEFLVVYVGRLLPRKDVRNVVRALALLASSTDQRVKLLVVGGQTTEPDPTATPEIGVLQRLAAELGVADRLQFTGKRQADVLRDYYSAGDVVVTTPWYEPFGLTPLEGMACGRPVVGSAVGGITFTIQDGVTGALVPPRDPAALAARLQSLLAQPQLRASMGRAARARVEQEFTWFTVAQRTGALYELLLEADNGATSPIKARFAVGQSAVTVGANERAGWSPAQQNGRPKVSQGVRLDGRRFER
jgi:glycosyltransferase involved in cell wall biosynthesis